MKKAILGIATVLALTTTTTSAAWARDAKALDKVASNAAGGRDNSSKSKGMIRAASKSADARVAKAEAPLAKTNLVDPNASQADRWLLEREGYRDGGY